MNTITFLHNYCIHYWILYFTGTQKNNKDCVSWNYIAIAFISSIYLLLIYYPWYFVIGNIVKIKKC